MNWRATLGTPTTLVLYRTPDRWRYALSYFASGDIADGSLAHPPAGSTPAEAETAALATAEQVAETHWWTDTITP